jgi:hypothetical protein
MSETSNNEYPEMTVRFRIVKDPDLATHSAKNAPTRPGLPNQSANHSERNTMVGTVSPNGLKTLACRRFSEVTGKQWRHATPAERTTWLERTVPVLKAEHGIAADAVWIDGVWQPAGQLDLFPVQRDLGAA